VTSAPHLKPFSALPGPRGLPLIGTLWDFAKPNGFGFNMMFEVMDSFNHYAALKPNTHRRRRRDSTDELSRVSVGGVY